jgi:hypothetical protein
MANKVTKKSLKKVTKKVTKKFLKKVTKKVTKKFLKKVTKKVTKKFLKKVTKKVIQKRGGGNCFRKPCDNGNSNKNSNEKVGFNSLPTEIHENIISYLLPMDYINYSKINQRYKDLAKYTLHLKSMARYWKALKNPPIGQFIRAWCDKMLLFNGEIEDPTILDTMLDSLERAVLLDDLFRNLALTIYHNIDITLNPHLASFEARLMSVINIFQSQIIDLEFNFNLEKIRAINTFVTLNEENDSHDLLIAMKIINEKKDIEKYESIHTSLLKKFDKEKYLFILNAYAFLPEKYLLRRLALNGLLNPDLDNQANINLRVELFEELFNRLRNNKRLQSVKYLMLYFMYIPTFMCKILLKKLKQLSIKAVFKFFTLPVRCGISPQIYKYNVSDIVPDSLKVRNYQDIVGFTEKNFNKFLEIRNTPGSSVSVDLMNEYARKIGLFNDDFCYYIQDFVCC